MKLNRCCPSFAALWLILRLTGACGAKNDGDPTCEAEAVCVDDDDDDSSGDDDDDDVGDDDDDGNDDDDDDDADDDDDGNETLDVCADGDSDAAGPRLLRRLTVAHYEATIREVFGLSKSQWVGPSLPPDPASRDGFNNQAPRLRVGSAFAAEILREAKDIAKVVASPEFLATHLTCASAANKACAQTYIETFGRRLFRRPLDADERERYLNLYDKVGAADDFSQFVYWATVALIQSPHMLYRTELGQASGNDRYELDAYELASALAYTYSGKPPSSKLLDRAEAGELDSPAALRAVAKELVYAGGEQVGADFRAVFANFVDQWLGLSKLTNATKDQSTFPNFSDGVRTAMRNETQRYVAAVVLENKGSVKDLLKTPNTYLDATLATYYGWGNASGTDFVETKRPDEWGVGLLAQGAILSITGTNTYTSPTKRGLMVRERILCHKMPSPPPVVPALPDAGSFNTTRERYENAHASVEPCKSCHRTFDPVGFAFEHFDSAGRRRESENGYPIDASGTLTLPAGDLHFDGVDALADTVSAMPDSATCMAAFLATHAFGLSHEDTPCLVTSAAKDLAQNNSSIVEYYLDLVTARHFTQRR